MTVDIPTVAEFTALLEEHVPNTPQLSGPDLEVLHLWKAEKMSDKLRLEREPDTSHLNAADLRKHNLLSALAIVFDRAYANVPKASTPPASEGLESEGSGCSSRTDGDSPTSGKDSDFEDAMDQEGSGLAVRSEALTQNTDKLEDA